MKYYFECPNCKTIVLYGVKNCPYCKQAFTPNKPQKGISIQFLDGIDKK